jgi:hypothetical protein
MALPTLLKTYEFNVNNRINATGNQYTMAENVLLAIKNMVIGYTNLPWTIAGSGVPGAGAMDAQDRWLTGADLTWHATVRSWIVFDRVDGTQVLIDLNYAGLPQQASISMSISGSYSGGGPGTPPTAADSVKINTGPDANHYGNRNNNGTVDILIHGCHSTDGTIDRIFLGGSGDMHGTWEFEPILNPRINHAITIMGTVRCETSSTGVCGLASMAVASFYSYEAGAMQMQVTSEGFTNEWLSEDSAASIAEELDGELFFNELGWWGVNVGYRGPKGRRPDVWMGQHQVANLGDNYPADISRQFVQIDTLIYPWDGTSVMVLA